MPPKKSLLAVSSALSAARIANGATAAREKMPVPAKPAVQDVRLNRGEVLELAKAMDDRGDDFSARRYDIMGPAEIEAAMADLDPDGTGEITFEQFYVWWDLGREGWAASGEVDYAHGRVEIQPSSLPGSVYAVSKTSDTKVNENSETKVIDTSEKKETDRPSVSTGTSPTLQKTQAKQKLGCCARFKICLRRCVETEVRGARLPELLAILAAFFLPVADISSDWAVVYGFHRDCVLFNGAYDDATKLAQFATAEGSVESPCTWRDWGLDRKSVV